MKYVTFDRDVTIKTGTLTDGEDYYVEYTKDFTGWYTVIKWDQTKWDWSNYDLQENIRDIYTGHNYFIAVYGDYEDKIINPCLM